MNGAAAFDDLALRQVDFHDAGCRVHPIFFLPMDIGLRLRFVNFLISEVNLVRRNSYPTPPAMGHEK